MITTTERDITRIKELTQRVTHAFETHTLIRLTEEEFAFAKFHNLFVLPESCFCRVGGRS
jgi:hypothetical protein